MVNVVIYTEPVAQGRPRFTNINGYPRAYEPEKSKQAKASIQRQVKGIVKQPYNEPIRLYVTFYRSLTQEMQRKVVKKQLKTPIFADKRPDLDNYVKLLKDALNGIFWTDDSLIVELVAKKYYDAIPRIEIEIQEITDDKIG